MGGIPGLHEATYIFPNGTFFIDRTKKEDNGRYTVEVYNASGVRVYTREYLLNMKEPVVKLEDEGVAVPFLLGGCASLDLDLQPRSYVIWKKGDRSLTVGSASNDMQYTEDTKHLTAHAMTNGTLRLCQLETEDQGEYTADVQNGQGALMYRKVFKLWPLDEPVVKLEDEGVAVPFLLGGCATLDLDLRPRSYVIWKKGNRSLTVGSATNDMRYAEDTKHLTAHVMTNGTLRLCQLETEDQGEYTADVLNGQRALMYRKVFKLWPLDGRKFVSGNSWTTLLKFILIVMGSGFFAFSVLALLVRCVRWRKKKDPEPVLEVVTYMERKLLKPNTEDLVETDVRRSQDQVVYAEVVLATTPSACPNESPECRGAETSSFTDEETISTQSREASTSHAESPAPSNVSTFQRK